MAANRIKIGCFHVVWLIQTHEPTRVDLLLIMDIKFLLVYFSLIMRVNVCVCECVCIRERALLCTLIVIGYYSS